MNTATKIETNTTIIDCARAVLDELISATCERVNPDTYEGACYIFNIDHHNKLLIAVDYLLAQACGGLGELVTELCKANKEARQ